MKNSDKTEKAGINAREAAAAVSADIRNLATPEFKKVQARFFRDEIKIRGTRSQDVKKIAQKHWKEFKKLDKEEILAICEELYKTGYLEETLIVPEFISRLRKEYAVDDIRRFEHLIDTYIKNWAACDGFCTRVMGEYLEKYPENMPVLKKWAVSENLWLRRAAAVSLIKPARKGDYLPEAFEIAGILLNDAEDMVQKGYGWLLKEESRRHSREVLDYVIENKQKMPRTALRYAIELMSEDMKAQAMKKD
ncbi:MAG: DNA alkylation repair protein [Methanomicrobium sp.]|nr:DNA alkylation repair protein [Methanomicrobium sp.]